MATKQSAQQSTNLQNVDMIAKLFGVTGRRIYQLTQDGVLPAIVVKGGRRYDLLPTIQRYIKYLQDIAQKKEKGKDAADREKKKDEADIKYKEAKARKVELELMELEGTMHRSEDVQAVITDLVFVIRGALVALPGRLAVDTANASAPTQTATIIRAEVNKILCELAAYEYDPVVFQRRVRDREGLGNVADEEAKL